MIPTVPTSASKRFYVFVSSTSSFEEIIMTVVRYEPWSLVNRFHRDIDRLFGAPQTTAADSGAWLPPVDIHEEDNRFLLHVDLPGVDPKAVEITSEQGVLTIRGRREDTQARGSRRLSPRRAHQRRVPAALQSAGVGRRAQHQGEGRQRRARGHNSEACPGAAAADRGRSGLTAEAAKRVRGTRSYGVKSRAWGVVARGAGLIVRPLFMWPARRI